jgi:hypothetical protein
MAKPLQTSIRIVRRSCSETISGLPLYSGITTKKGANPDWVYTLLGAIASTCLLATTIIIGICRANHAVLCDDYPRRQKSYG